MRRRAVAGALAFVLLGFAALLALPQAAHAQAIKTIWDQSITVAATTTPTTLFGNGQLFPGSSHDGAETQGSSDRTQVTVTAFQGGGSRYIYDLRNDNASPGTLKLTITLPDTGTTELFDDADFLARLTLHLGTASFAAADATVTKGDTNDIYGVASATPTFTWSSSGLTWSDMLVIAASMTLSVPDIESITFSDAGTDGAYAIDDGVTATVTFSEAVTVTGTPQLTIDVGGSEKTLDYASGSGTTALVFSGYTVAANEEDTDGLSVAENKLTLNSGTIKASAGGNPDADLDHVAVPDSANHKVDGVKPTLVTTGTDAPRTSTDGTQVIYTFSEDIGSVTLNSFNLEVDNGPNQQAGATEAISGRTVTVTLLPVFTIQYGQAVEITLAAGSVRDTAGNRNSPIEDQAVTNTIPPPPAVISMVEITSDPGTDQIYATDDDIEVTATFDQVVAVTGTPRINVLLGGGSSGRRWAEYASGSGSTALVFAYPVVATDESDTDGIGLGNTASTTDHVDLNGGTITVVATGEDASLAYTPVVSDSGHRVNWVRPALSGAVTSTDGTKVILTFSEDLDGTAVGHALFTVKVDGTAVMLSGTTATVSGTAVTLTLATALTSATQTVTVSYADPTTGDDSTGLQDLAGNDADSFTDETVTNRFTALMVPTAVDLYSVSAHATTTPGSVQVLWSGGNVSTSHEFRASTDSGVNWSHDVTDDWPDVTTDSKGLSHLAGLTPGTAYTFEVRGRNADGPGPAGQRTGTTAAAMSITGVALTSSPAMGTTYDTGEDVEATLTFSRPVTFADVGGNLPQLELDVGGTGKPATCAATNQQTAVVCTYTVVSGDTASAGVAIAANKLTLNGGTIRMGAGSLANVDYDVPLTHTELAADTDHKVSTTTVLANPTVGSFAFNSAGLDNTFAIGDAVTATVAFSEAVTVVTTGGTPQLTINMGGSDKVLNYASGTGTAALVFSGYTVAENDEDTDGLSIAANKLDANGGTIKATAGANLDAVLTHAAVADSASRKVDGIRPTLVTTSTDGTEVLLTFSEDLKGTSVAANLFTVKVDGTAVTLSGSAAISGSVVTLTLGTVLTSATQVVTVSYADPTSGDDSTGLQDLADNDADSFTDQMVTNRFTAPMVPSAVDLYSVAVHATTTPGSVQIQWAGGDGSTSHEFRASTDSGANWNHDVTDDWPDVTTDSRGLSHLAGLTPGTAYTFEVRGRNAEGPGPAGQNTGTTAAAMSITGVALTSSPAMGTTYDTGEDVEATLTFSRPVTFADVGGNLPQLELDVGGTGKPATCAATTTDHRGVHLHGGDG